MILSFDYDVELNVFNCVFVMFLYMFFISKSTVIFIYGNWIENFTLRDKVEP